MKFWENFLQEQEKLLGKENTDKWLRSLKILRFDARNIHLEAQNTFQMHWFEEHVRKQTKTLKNGSGRPFHIALSLAHNSSKKGSTKKARYPKTDCFQSDCLVNTHIFDSFYVSEENRLTYNIVKALSTSTAYNPVFIYAPKGCGKTHLLMSAAHAFKAASLKTLYIRAETFTSHVVRAIQLANMQKFRQIYRSIDALIFDDVHILAGKKATQEEFFHTFNELHTAGKRLLISSPLPPQELLNIEPRLISRFEWGICLGLEPPSTLDLRSILRLRSHSLDLTLSEKQIRFFLQSFHSLTSLHTALDALALRNPSKDTPLEKVLSDLLEREKDHRVTPEMILAKTAKELEISQEEIVGKSQQTKACLARKIAIYLLRHELKLPFMHIAKIFHRDHSTIMSALKTVEKKLPEALIRVQKALE